jgi:hypothetical protein
MTSRQPGLTTLLSVVGIAVVIAAYTFLRPDQSPVDSGADLVPAQETVQPATTASAGLHSDQPHANEPSGTNDAGTGAPDPSQVALGSGSQEIAYDFHPNSMMQMGAGGPEGLAGTCDIRASARGADADEIPFTIACNAGGPAFGGLFRPFPAEPFLGRRVRFSAELMTNELTDIAGVSGLGSIWIRIDTPNGSAADNGRDRGISGTTDWQLLQVEKLVPENARTVSVGFWGQGQGELHVRGVSLEQLD